MITLTVPANQIPDGEKVRRPTGAAYYFLNRHLTIYGPDDKKEVFPGPNVLFLVGGANINAIRDDTQLSIDFETMEGAADWIDLNRDD
jgi:hypothetical protein